MTCTIDPIIMTLFLAVFIVGFIGNWAMLAHVLEALSDDFNLDDYE